MLIANKWGYLTDGNNWRQDTSPDYCRKALTTALKNPNTDYIDVYIMRGLDGTTDIEDSVKAMAVSMVCQRPSLLQSQRWHHAAHKLPLLLDICFACCPLGSPV